MVFWALILLDVLLWIEVARMEYAARRRHKAQDAELARRREANE